MRVLLYIGILLGAVACGHPNNLLQSGDLLFMCGENSEMTGAITAATGSDGRKNAAKNGDGGLDFAHVGIAVCANEADSVLEATTEGGVRMTALAEYLDRAARIDNRPAVIAKRLRDTTGVAAAIARARTHIGLPYDYAFGPGADAFYCSELVQACYLRADGSPVFATQPMNFRAADGTMPQFWVALFAGLGKPIPQGVSGTNPNDMAREAALAEVYRYF